MIHLLLAREVNQEAPDLFWVGNFAPDFTNEREIKDRIHLRTASNRLEALSNLRDTLDAGNPFEMGWLLHLFADMCWDSSMYKSFQQKYENITTDQHWFSKYREELGFASFYLYHHLDWAPQLLNQIKNTDLSSISSGLPISQQEIEGFRDRVYDKHTLSDPASISSEFNEALLLNFARETAQKYKAWNKQNDL